MEIVNEINKIKENIPYFLEKQQGKENKDYFKYSFSGDLWGEDMHWNVGASVFAAKIAYTIGMEKSDEIVQHALNHISSFQHSTGYIYDDRIRPQYNMKKTIKQLLHGKLPIFSNQEYIRAESRQCFSALMMYEVLLDSMPESEIVNKNQMDCYLEKFDWNQPWGAGSHYSHMLFFQKLGLLYKRITADEYKENIKYAKQWIDKIYNQKTGSWHRGNVSTQQAINGAMKVMTGFKITDKLCVNEEEGRRLIDLCLANVNNEQACDNFNIVYVLYYASQACQNYRKSEIKEFAEKRFRIYMEYYYPKHGGFSFYKGKTNEYYYGCRITKGLKEPDMHGTTLFLWGISIICKILEIEKETGLREFIT